MKYVGRLFENTDITVLLTIFRLNFFIKSRLQFINEAIILINLFSKSKFEIWREINVYHILFIKLNSKATAE